MCDINIAAWLELTHQVAATLVKVACLGDFVAVFMVSPNAASGKSALGNTDLGQAVQ